MLLVGNWGKPVDQIVQVRRWSAEAMKEEGNESDDHQDGHELAPWKYCL